MDNTDADIDPREGHVHLVEMSVAEHLEETPLKSSTFLNEATFHSGWDGEESISSFSLESNSEKFEVFGNSGSHRQSFLTGTFPDQNGNFSATRHTGAGKPDGVETIFDTSGFLYKKGSFNKS